MEMGEVVSLTKKELGARLSLNAKALAPDAGLGDSISINGACLTVTGIKGDLLEFDISDETLKSTNLGWFKKGDSVNIEPSLRADSKLGGHFVTGHIDGVGRIKSKTLTGDVYKIVIGVEERIARLLVEKGSVAIDGISLTVVDVFREGFSIVIIPHTARVTTIGFKGQGDSVNIETDILGKYVSKSLNRDRNESLMRTLAEEGFA